MILRLSFILCFVLSMTACISLPYGGHTAGRHPVNPPVHSPAVPQIPKKVSPATHFAQQQHTTRKLLLSQYQDWYAAPYRLGGLSKRGIDCSGFVYLTFRQQLQSDIPRTTKEQAKHGHLIAKSKLQIGDLVFFKTDKKVRHVGIYIGNNEFIHASTNRGVMLSQLDNPYWKKRFWKVKRYPI